jgi:hypothetical protein
MTRVPARSGRRGRGDSSSPAAVSSASVLPSRSCPRPCFRTSRALSQGHFSRCRSWSGPLARPTTPRKISRQLLPFTLALQPLRRADERRGIVSLQPYPAGAEMTARPSGNGRNIDERLVHGSSSSLENSPGGLIRVVAVVTVVDRPRTRIDGLCRTASSGGSRARTSDPQQVAITASQRGSVSGASPPPRRRQPSPLRWEGGGKCIVILSPVAASRSSDWASWRAPVDESAAAWAADSQDEDAGIGFGESAAPGSAACRHHSR